MALKLAGRGELTEFVTDHVLADEDRDVNLAVVDGDGPTTISGEMVDWRAQVLITVRSSAERAATFFASL